MHIYLTLQSKAKRGNQVQPKKEKIEIASTDLIVHDPAPSALNTGILLHQSTHKEKGMLSGYREETRMYE